MDDKDSINPVARDGLADQWEKEIESPPGNYTSRNKILEQEEIDKIFGIHYLDVDEPSTGKGGTLTKIFADQEFSDKDLPLLDVIFDRMASLTTTSLRNLTSCNIDVSMDENFSIRFSDYANSVSLPSLLVVFRALEWDSLGIVVLSHSMVYSIINVLLGSRQVLSLENLEDRMYTLLEITLVEEAVEVILSDLSSALRTVTEVNFNVERSEVNPTLAKIVQDSVGTLVARFKIDIEGNGGVMDIVLPHPSIGSLKEKIARAMSNENIVVDHDWKERMKYNLTNTTVKLEAVLEEKTVDLSELQDLCQKRANLELQGTADDKIVKLQCNGVKLAEGTVGYLGNRIGINISSLNF